MSSDEPGAPRVPSPNSARIPLADLAFDREALRLEGGRCFRRHEKFEKLARLRLCRGSQCNRIEDLGMAILWKRTDDFDRWLRPHIGAIDDAEWHLAPRDESERSAHIFRLGHARRHLIPHAE